MPTLSKVCPCDLLMVMAKAKITGNCSLLSLNGKSESVGDMDIRGMKTVRSLCFPVEMVATMTLPVRFLMRIAPTLRLS